MKITHPVKGSVGYVRCDEDPSKWCPYKASIRVTDAGVISASSDGLMKCCHTKKQLEAARKISLDRNRKR